MASDLPGGFAAFPHDCIRNQVVCQTCRDNWLEYNEHCRDPRMRYTEIISDADAKVVIRGFAESIESDYQFLRTTISQQGDELLERWTAKSTEQRGALLRRSLPTGLGTTGIGEECHVLQEYWGLERRPWDSEKRVSLIQATAIKRRSQYRTSVLLSNLDWKAYETDMTALLCLLQNRTLHPPRKWAALDHRLTRFGFDSGLLARRYSGSCYNVWDITQKYGESFEWTEERYHEDRSLVGFPRAEILFESQRELYALLRKIVAYTLTGTRGAAKGATKWNAQAVSLFRSQIDKSWTNFPAEEPGLGQAADRQYRSPPDLNIDKMVQCARSRQAIAKEELLLLQNDSVFFKARLNEFRQANFYSSMTKLDKKEQAQEWQFLALGVWEWPFRRVASWDEVAMWAEIAQQENTANARASLHYHMKIHVKSFFGTMIADLMKKGHVFPGIPYDRNKFGPAEDEKIKLSRDPLHWAMTTLARWLDRTTTALQLPEVVQLAAQSIATMDSKNLAEFSRSGVLELVNDMAALSSMICTLEGQSPPLMENNWAYLKVGRNFAEEWVKSYRESGSQYYSTLPNWQDVFERYGTPGITSEELLVPGKLLKKFYDSEELTAPVRLQRFWRSMDSHRVDYLERSNDNIATISEGSEPRSLSLPRLEVPRISETQDVKIMQHYKTLDTGDELYPESVSSDRDSDAVTEEHCSCTTLCRTARCYCYKNGLPCSSSCHGSGGCENNQHVIVSNISSSKIQAKPCLQPKRKLPEKPQKKKAAESSVKSPKKLVDSSSKAPKKMKPATSSAAAQGRQERLDRRNGKKSAR